MSRKRKEKKARKRQSEAEEAILRLYERGSYLELLTVARRRFSDPLRSEVGTLYEEVADRALTERLSAGDLDGLSEVLQVLGPTVRGRPVAELASGVLAVRAGGEAADLSKLERLGEGAGGDAPEAVSAAAQRLLALVGRRSGASSQGGGVERLGEVSPTGDDLARLRRGLERLPWTSKGTMPPVDLGLEGPLARALWLAARATAAIARRGYEPTMRQINELGQAVASIRGLEIAEPYRLEERIEPRRALLEELLAKVRRLRRSPGGRLIFAVQRLYDLDLVGQLGVSVSEPSGDPILGHLDHAVRKLWWEVVSLCGVRSRRGGAEVVRLASRFPRALQPLLEVEGEVGSGTGRSLREELGSLLEEEAYYELAVRMGDVSVRESDPLRRALMWGVELRAWDQAQDMEDFVDYEDDGDDLGPSESGLAMLDRLVTMARDLKRRFPEGQRAGLATVLKESIVMATLDLPMSDERFARASRLLLEVLPGDAVLLMIRAAVCFEKDDLSEAQRAVAQLETATPVKRIDQRLLNVLVSGITEQTNETLDATFEAAWHLFPPEAWAEAFAARIPEWPKDTAKAALDPAAMLPEHLLRPLALERLDLIEKYCGPSMPLEVARFAVSSSGEPSVTAVRELLEQHGEVGAALLLADMLNPDGGLIPASGSLGAVEDELVTVAIAHLDLPVREWYWGFEVLVALAARTQQLTALMERFAALWEGAIPDSDDALMLEKAIDVISHLTDELERVRRLVEHEELAFWQERARREQSARRKPLPPEVEQLSLVDLWGDEDEDDDSDQ